MNRQGQDRFQLTLAHSLRGQFVRFHHQPTHPGYLVLRVIGDGMIELEGLPGRFAPHLFECVDAHYHPTERSWE